LNHPIEVWPAHLRYVETSVAPLGSLVHRHPALPAMGDSTEAG